LDKNTKYARHADRVKDWIQEQGVLDIGCGDGLITSLLNGGVGIDSDETGVSQAQEKGVDARVGSAYEIPFHDNQFSSAFMGDVLEHLEDYRKGLREARRVLTNYLYLVVPEKGTNNDKFHYQEWTSEEILKLIKEEGFELEGDVMLSPKLKRIYLKLKKV
jgi:ubiquinone/menaquinone biosynthesis C-methylase UbiE